MIANARAALGLPGGLSDAGLEVRGPARRRAADASRRSAAPRPASKALAAELKRHGFTFTGPVTAYATMQACGIVNDHLAGYFAREGCYRPGSRPVSSLTGGLPDLSNATGALSGVTGPQDSFRSEALRCTAWVDQTPCDADIAPLFAPVSMEATSPACWPRRTASWVGSTDPGRRAGAVGLGPDRRLGSVGRGARPSWCEALDRVAGALPAEAASDPDPWPAVGPGRARPTPVPARRRRAGRGAGTATRAWPPALGGGLGSPRAGDCWRSPTSAAGRSR